jgi:hypothetical protein
MKVIIDGVVEGLSTRSDGSVKLVLATQELESSKAGDLFQLRNKYVKVLISDTNISSIEEQIVDQEKLVGGKKAKTPASRLRSVMFRVHESRGISIDFDQWYKNEMENKITYYKEILNNI